MRIGFTARLLVQVGLGGLQGGFDPRLEVLADTLHDQLGHGPALAAGEQSQAGMEAGVDRDRKNLFVAVRSLRLRRGRLVGVRGGVRGLDLRGLRGLLGGLCHAATTSSRGARSTSGAWSPADLTVSRVEAMNTTGGALLVVRSCRDRTNAAPPSRGSSGSTDSGGTQRCRRTDHGGG